MVEVAIEDHVAYQARLIEQYWSLFDRLGEVSTRLCGVQREFSGNILGEQAATALEAANREYLMVTVALARAIDELKERRQGHYVIAHPGQAKSNITECEFCSIYDYLSWR